MDPNDQDNSGNQNNADEKNRLDNPKPPDYPQSVNSQNSSNEQNNLPASGSRTVPENSFAQPLSAAGTLEPSGESLKKKRLKLAVIIAAAATLILGGSAAAYFGVYVPNQPENIWKKSLENSGKGYDKLIEYADKKKDVKGGKLGGNFKVEFGKTVADGTIESKYDEKNSDTKISVGTAGTRFELNMLTTTPEGTKYPDFYAKISGLKGIDQILGPQAGGIGASLASFENQWYVVDHTLFDQAEKSATQEIGYKITGEDVTAFAKDMGGVTKEYALTDNPSKAVLVVKQNIGKETMDGRKVYHYKVGVNKVNLKDFNTAACNKALQSKLVKAFSAGGPPPFTEQDCKDTSDIDKINENDTFDIWVDLKTKLIRTVRITEKDKKNNYFDFGLLYNGGDEYPFVIRGQSKDEKGDGKGELKVTLNTKTGKTNIVGNIDGKEDGSTYKVGLNATFEQSADKVEFKKPEGAKSLLEAYGALVSGFGGFTGAAGGAPADQTLINRCIVETTPSPECEALFNQGAPR